MTVDFELPDLGEGVAEGEVLAWHVEPGDRVTEDQIVAEVETDKAAVEVPSSVDGVVTELHAEVGEMVAVGDVLISFEEDADDGERVAEAGAAAETATADDAAAGEETATAQTEVSTTDGRVFAAPSVRRLAREEGVDISAVEGSGPGGRVTESDVRAAAEAGSGQTAEARAGTDGASSETDDGPTSVVSRVSDEGSTDGAAASDGTDEGPTVKSAVRKVSSDDSQAAAARRDQTLATPATRRVARELGVDIDEIPTDQTRDGQPYVDEAAVRAFAEQQATAADAGAAAADSEAAGASTTAEASADTVTADAATGTAASVSTDESRERREPYRGVRRSIGEQMSRSRREVPHATHHDTVAVPGLVDARERLQPLAEERGVRLTYMPFLLKCVAAALEDHPIINTSLDLESEEIVYKEYYDIGVAVATDHGLVVPVVEAVDQKGLLELARELDDLVERARDRDLAREEMQGGTFTVTNFGAIGGEYADPVINVPETAILGVGSLEERPVAEDGEVMAKPTLPLSLAIDHRVIDGADGARFTNTLMEYLADPTRLLLE